MSERRSIMTPLARAIEAYRLEPRVHGDERAIQWWASVIEAAEESAFIRAEERVEQWQYAYTTGGAADRGLEECVRHDLHPDKYAHDRAPHCTPCDGKGVIKNEGVAATENGPYSICLKCFGRGYELSASERAAAEKR